MFRILLGLLAAGAISTFVVGEPETQRVKRVSSSAIEDGGVKFDDAKADRSDRESGNSQPLDFPIILPPYNYVDLKTEDFGPCLLYLESISVVVFASGNKVESRRDFSSASAIVRGGANQKNKFLFDSSFVNCFAKNNDTKNKEFSFQIKVNIVEPAEAKALKDNKETLFTVSDDLDFTLKFKIDKYSSWNLVDLQLNSPLSAKKGSWLSQDISIPAGKSSINAAKVTFGGFKNYNFACSSTPLIAWAVDTGKDSASIGISFNNIQIQAYDIWSSTPKGESRKTYRFSTNVNDCVGTFSIGSWMGIIVLLVFLGILTFGYLMLNSVQTMDRFDDPKQKQLIINAKE